MDWMLTELEKINGISSSTSPWKSNRYLFCDTLRFLSSRFREQGRRLVRNPILSVSLILSPPLIDIPQANSEERASQALIGNFCFLLMVLRNFFSYISRNNEGVFSDSTVITDRSYSFLLEWHLFAKLIDRNVTVLGNVVYYCCCFDNNGGNKGNVIFDLTFKEIFVQ